MDWYLIRCAAGVALLLMIVGAIANVIIRAYLGLPLGFDPEQFAQDIEDDDDNWRH